MTTEQIITVLETLKQESAIAITDARGQYAKLADAYKFYTKLSETMKALSETTAAAITAQENRDRALGAALTLIKNEGNFQWPLMPTVQSPSNSVAGGQS